MDKSRSFLLWAIVIILVPIIRRLGIKICLLRPRWKVARKIGMALQGQQNNSNQSIRGLERLSLETYFKLALSTFLS